MLQFSFILVDAEEDGNIGAAARALKTMGHGDLRLVRPQANHLSERAQALAHGSQAILEAAQCYDNLSQALQGIDFACATTARHRLVKHTYISIRDLPDLIRQKGDLIQRVALVFGGERSGLSGEDIDQCDLVSTVPQSCSYPSLNLAQAVMIYSFVFSEEQTRVQIQDQRLNRDQMAPDTYASFKTLVLELMQRVEVSPRYQHYVTKALARLGYEDLCLLHTIRRQIARTLDRQGKDPG